MDSIASAGPVATFLGKNLYYLLLAVLFLNLLQRRHMQTGRKKRFATLYIAVAVLVLMSIALGIMRFRLPDLLLVPAAAALGILFYVYRDRVLPFRLRCHRCHAKLDYNRVLYHDSNLCADCDRQVHGDADTGDAGITGEPPAAR